MTCDRFLSALMRTRIEFSLNTLLAVMIMMD